MSILFEKLYVEKTQHPSPHKPAIIRKPAAAEPKQENRRPTLLRAVLRHFKLFIAD